ncbi:MULTISPECIES: hypothetical protein [unclassified Enterococcus]|uniref:hypothetical protein n=1 Tax=unclassified Enterococcus TaxID=2608891 RepID=UPI001CE0DF25|nr:MULTISPECIES: hypothetical protein [unclassified Enterococcus]MCA5014553.1 hypothetical protein [Enterococcus sp. S23]MCA5017806.1 hypothetical protein [Enterococcus sp. S22(2020)]
MYQEYLSEIDNVPLFPIWLIATLAVMIIVFICLIVWILICVPHFLLDDALTFFSIFLFLSVGSIGFSFYKQSTAKDFIDYRYVIKTENGYQLRTLSKQYPGLSEGEIYIQEKAETVSPKIILEQRQYKEKEFNKVFGSGEKRVIFIVPEGTVQTKFEEGVIK